MTPITTESSFRTLSHGWHARADFHNDSISDAVVFKVDEGPLVEGPENSLHECLPVSTRPLSSV